MKTLTKNIFQAAASREMTWFFPQRMNNSVMLWASFNGLVGLILFTLSYQLFGKKHGVSISSGHHNHILHRRRLHNFLIYIHQKSRSPCSNLIDFIDKKPLKNLI